MLNNTQHYSVLYVCANKLESSEIKHLTSSHFEFVLIIKTVIDMKSRRWSGQKSGDSGWEQKVIPEL